MEDCIEIKTSWNTVVHRTDFPYSARNRCVIKILGGVFVCLRSCCWLFAFYRGLRRVAGSDIFPSLKEFPDGGCRTSSFSTCLPVLWYLHVF